MLLIQRFPFASFVVIAFGWTWPLALLIHQSLLFPLLALFGPLLAAVLVAAALHGRKGPRDLFRHFELSRTVAGWSVAAALLPIALLVPVWLLHCWWWGPIPFKPAPVQPIGLALALLIVGEEVGWRGFALPYLLEKRSPLAASLIVGVIWAAWHLPNFLTPGYPQHGLPFAAFLVTVTAYAVLFTWFHIRTKGSLLVAVVFHASLNLCALEGMDPIRQSWLEAVVYAVVAVIFAMRFNQSPAKNSPSTVSAS